MKKSAREALDAYYAEGDSWARNTQDDLRRSRKAAWIIAGAAALVAVCEAIALIVLLPLKTVEPYTLLVDRQTGFVQPLKPLDPQLVSSEAALTQSFLVQYVIAREGYDIDSLQSDYRKVSLWSDGDARRSYLAAVQASNPDSPLAAFPRSTVINVAIKSVTAIGRNVSMVRYTTQRLETGGQVRALRDWVAVIRYGYSGAPMSSADRLVNPLGFQVTRYRRSIEMLPAPALPATSVPADPVGPPPVYPQTPYRVAPVVR